MRTIKSLFACVSIRRDFGQKQFEEKVISETHIIFASAKKTEAENVLFKPERSSKGLKRRRKCENPASRVSSSKENYIDMWKMLTINHDFPGTRIIKPEY